MNAYEMADLLLTGAYPIGTREEIANMLRQQANRIESLLKMAEDFQLLIISQKQRIAELEKDLHMLQRHYDQLDHDLPNAEPVAWSDEFQPNKECSYNHVVYETPFGKIYITWKGWKEHPSYDVEAPFDWHIDYFAGNTLDEAKNIAETIYKEKLAKSYTTPQTKPLSDEEIIKIAKDCGYANRYELNIYFARAIEERILGK